MWRERQCVVSQQRTSDKKRALCIRSKTSILPIWNLAFLLGEEEQLLSCREGRKLFDKPNEGEIAVLWQDHVPS